MLLQLEHVIDEATIKMLRSWLSEAVFEDGRLTAGVDAAKVKSNEQVSEDDPKTEAMEDLIIDHLWDHDLFVEAARPKRIRPPLFSRYTPGMQYGTHVDSAIMGDERIDLSVTLFLSDPADYDGGELVVELGGLVGEQHVKLPAGSAVLYPTTVLHRVAPITRGVRLAAVTWVRSFVRDPAEREMLYDLKTAQVRLSDQLGKTPEIDLIAKVRANLLRKWIED